MFTTEEAECLIKAAKKYSDERRAAGKPTSIIDGVIAKVTKYPDALQKAREKLQACESLSDSNDCACGWIGKAAQEGMDAIDEVMKCPDEASSRSKSSTT